MAEYGKRPLWQWVLLYIVIGGIVYAGIYYFFLAKKGGYGYTPGTTSSSSYTPPGNAMTYTTPATAQSQVTGPISVALAAENGSGESGTATLTEANGKVTVLLSLTGYPKGIVQPAHIHIGACPGVGTVKYPLTYPINGTSTTTLDVTLAQLKEQLPLAINVHKSQSAVSTYVSCGVIKFP